VFGVELSAQQCTVGAPVRPVLGIMMIAIMHDHTLGYETMVFLYLQVINDLRLQKVPQKFTCAARNSP